MLGSIFLIIPAIATTWPALAPVISAAAGALGYTATHEVDYVREELHNRTNAVELVMDNTEILAETLGKETEILFQKDKITMGFRVNVRGKCTIKVWGAMTPTQLHEQGKLFAEQILQQYVYAKVSSELPQKGFSIVNENTDEKNSINLQIRRWR